MSQLNIIIQEKGGLAKTFLTIHLMYFLSLHGHKFRPVDCDFEDGLVSRIFPPPNVWSISPNPRLLDSGESQMPHLMNRAMGKCPPRPPENFIIDCGANTAIAWELLMTETWPDLPNQLALSNVKVTLIVPVDNDRKSRDSFEKYKQLFPFANIILVVIRKYKNLEMKLPDHPKEMTIELPMAPDRLFETYRSKEIAIDEIAKGIPGLELEMGFAQGYLPRLHSEFNSVLQYLVP